MRETWFTTALHHKENQGLCIKSKLSWFQGVLDQGYMDTEDHRLTSLLMVEIMADSPDWLISGIVSSIQEVEIWTLKIIDLHELQN